MSLNKRLMSSAPPALVPSEHFGIKAYTGNGSSQSITGVGFQPDLLWIKQRLGTNPHLIMDSTRGAGKLLVANTSALETGNSGNFVGSFDADGFQVNRNYLSYTAHDTTNYGVGDGAKYIAYCWKANGGTTASNSNGSVTSTVQANDAAGFSIVSYTGTGSNLTFGHGLSAAPDLVILKNREGVGAWLVQHSSLGPTKALYLETTTAQTDNATFWNDTAPTTTTVSLGTHSDGNVSGDDGIAYCWRDVDGYSKFDSYTGNGDAFGPIIETGFEVGWLIIRRIDSGDNWLLFDNVRHEPTNNNLGLIPNNTPAESVGNLGNGFTFLSNGFQVVSSDSGVNASGGTFVYMAFATDPDTVVPTLADSFNIKTYAGNSTNGNSLSGVGFSPDLVWIKERDGTDSHEVYDSIRGSGNVIYANGGNAQYGGSNFTSFDADGFTLSSASSVNESGKDYIGWCWKANDDDVATPNDNGSIDSITSVNANAGFSVVKYKGTGSAATVGHGLSSAPEIMWIKDLDNTRDWAAYHKYNVGNSGNGHTERLKLNSDTGNQDDAGGAYWNSTAPSSTVFSIGTEGNVNTSGQEYIAYCWHSVTGYSKFGSYTGTAGSFTVTTGFQPDFVMIKRADDTGNWVMVDSPRASGGTRLYANVNNAEDTGQGESFSSTGFSPRTSSTADTNIDGGNYIYAAWKIN